MMNHENIENGSNFTTGCIELWRPIQRLYQKIPNWLKLILKALFYLIILLAGIILRPALENIQLFRGLAMPVEQYSGNYIQIIEEGDERRYSLVQIHYNKKRSVYALKGSQYTPEGLKAADFRSDNVFIVHDPYPRITFKWSAITLPSRESHYGYTEMTPYSLGDNKNIEGEGFFFTFNHNGSEHIDLTFIQLTEEKLENLNLDLPHTESERSHFIRDFHEIMLHNKDIPSTGNFGKPSI